MAFSLWIGEMLGAVYMGFLVVAAFFGLLFSILALFRFRMKKAIKNKIIKEFNQSK
jgi:hypothetical protein